MWIFLLENITIIAVIVLPLAGPEAERFLLVVDIAQDTELTAAVGLVLPFSSR